MAAEERLRRSEADGRVARLRMLLRGAERREAHASLARALGCWHVALCLDSVAQLETLGRLGFGWG